MKPIGPNIGLLGGSFDPVHLAHIALAQAALRELRLEQVQLIPAARPWQRGALQAPPAHRLRMLEIAIRNTPGLAVNCIELDRGGLTYTIDTLRALPAGPRYVWLLGADQLSNFCTWRDWQGIVAQVDLAVAVRPGTPLAAPAELTKQLTAQGKTLAEIPFAPQDVSASAIRARLAAGQDVDELLSPAVTAYIATHRLYRQRAAIR